MWKHCRRKFRLSNQINCISSYKLTVCSSEFVSSHVLSKASSAVTSGHVASRAWHPKLAMTVLPEPVLKTYFNHKSSKNVHLSKSVISKQRLSTSNQGNVFSCCCCCCFHGKENSYSKLMMCRRLVLGISKMPLIPNLMPV